MRKIGDCDVDKFGTLDSSEKTIPILGDSVDGGHTRRNWKGITKAKRFYLIHGKKRNERPNVGVSLFIRSRSDAPSRKGCMRGQYGKMTKPSNICIGGCRNWRSS